MPFPEGPGRPSRPLHCHMRLPRLAASKLDRTKKYATNARTRLLASSQSNDDDDVNDGDDDDDFVNDDDGDDNGGGNGNYDGDTFNEGDDGVVILILIETSCNRR